MQLKDLECQLAQAQLTRYLRGAALSAEALEALEAHISECSTCKAEVTTKRTELELAGQVETVAPTEPGEPQTLTETPPAIPPLKAAVILRLLDKLPANSRPIVLSTALALLLIAMSTVAKDPTKVFGERLSKSANSAVLGAKVERKEAPSAVEIEHKRFTQSPSSKPDSGVGSTPKATPALTAKPATVKPTPTIGTGVVKPSSRRSSPTATRRTPIRRKPGQAKRTIAARKPSPKVQPPAPRKTGGIVVYDENGNRIN